MVSIIKKIKFKYIILAFLLILSFLLISNSRKDNIDRILNSDAYSYLPMEAKDYIKMIYEKTNEVVLTEKNKVDNMPYLNPRYIEYLTLSSDEKEQIELIPDTYVVDYIPSEVEVVSSSIPSQYDFRNIDGKNYLTPMKNQGSLGVCWAMSTVENAETFLMLQNNKAYDENTEVFSTRQVDYVTSTNGLKEKELSTGYAYIFDNSLNGSRSLTGGGNFYVSSIAMANGLSLTSEEFLPWNESKNSLYPNEVLSYDDSKYEITSTIQLPMINKDTASSTEINSFNNLIKEYMLEYGAPFVSTYSPSSTCGFTNTDGKYFIKTDDCVNANLNLGHAMQIIGWDDEYEYAYCDDGVNHYNVKNGKCSTGTYKEGKGAWILRNSWGDQSAYKYVYLTYDSTRLSIGFITGMSKMENRSWDNNYHNNPWIDGSVYNGLLSVLKQTSEYKIKNSASEKIEKIKFMSSSLNGNYSVTITADGKTYDNVASISTTEIGIYTIDISDKNITVNDSFSVYLSGGYSYRFYYDSISVFTSNVNQEKYVTTYSKDAYDNELPLSEINPLYVDSNSDWSTEIDSYLSNIPSNSELTYRLKKDDIIYDEFSLYLNTLVNNYINGQFLGKADTDYGTFNISEHSEETFDFEILYNGEIVNSFPIKFNSSTEKSQSNVRIHANNGTDYYYDFMVTDKEEHNFKNDLLNRKEFYNNGYYIMGWNTEADGSGDYYDISESILIYGDIDLYAVWSKDYMDYNIEFMCLSTDKCSGSQDNILINYNDNLIFPKNSLVYSDMAFIKWQAINSNQVYGYYAQETMDQAIGEFLSSKMGVYKVFNNSSYTFYATWSSLYAEISFDSNGGEGIMDPISVITYLEDGKLASNMLKDNLFKKDGYEFVEWNTKADGSGISYSDNAYISTDKDITLYAQWKQIDIYIITFYGNNGTNEFLTQGVSASAEITLRANEFLYTGHKFTGWNTEANGSGTSYKDKDNINVNSNVTLYAQWELLKYTLTFNANGGVGTMEKMIFTHGVSNNINGNSFTREGYTFSGWNTKANGSGTLYKDKEEITLNSDITLYAQWIEDFTYRINKYTVDESKKYISNISIGTNINTYKSNIELNTNYTVKIDNKNNLLYTGSKTVIYKNGNKYVEYTNIVLGDINGDGLINSADLLKIRQHLLGINKLNGVYYLSSDINGDNTINSADLLRIRQHLLGVKKIS